MADANESQLVGTVVRQFFIQGRLVPSWIGRIEGFPAEAYGELWDIISVPLRIEGEAVARAMDHGEMEMVEQELASRKWLPREAFALFNEGWIAVAMRATSFERSRNDYRSSTQIASTEEDLFTFFVSGCAIFDSFAFAVFAAASMLAPRHFRIDREGDLKDVNLGRAVRKFAALYRGSTLADALGGLRSRDAYLALHEMRNVLVHRASPGFYTTEDGSSTWWAVSGHVEQDVPMNQETLDHLYELTMGVLTDLTLAAVAFFRDEFDHRVSAT